MVGEEVAIVGIFHRQRAQKEGDICGQAVDRLAIAQHREWQGVVNFMKKNSIDGRSLFLPEGFFVIVVQIHAG